MIFTNVGIQIFRNQSIHVSLVLMIPEIYYGFKVVFFPQKNNSKSERSDLPARTPCLLHVNYIGIAGNWYYMF